MPILPEPPSLSGPHPNGDQKKEGGDAHQAWPCLAGKPFTSENYFKIVFRAVLHSFPHQLGAKPYRARIRDHAGREAPVKPIFSRKGSLRRRAAKRP